MIQNNLNNATIYSEVYSILQCMNQMYINKIPKGCLKLIEENKSNLYNPKYDLKYPLKDQNIKRETLALLALLYLNYWCNSEEEKEGLIQQFKNNEQNYQAELKEKYKTDNIFKQKELNEKVKKETSIGVIPKEKWYQKFFNFIKRFFKKV